MNLASSLPPSVKTALRPWRDAARRVGESFNEGAAWSSLKARTWATKLRRTVSTPATPAAAGGKLNLHLGCGPVDRAEFINIDGFPFPHVHYVQGIDRLPQFRDATVDLIYASHCLEHFHYRRTRAVLAEWFRVLKPGGILRISVPDFDKLVDIYLHHDRDPETIIEQLMGGQNNRYNFHYTALNERSLTRDLRAAGFREVRLWTPGTEPTTTFPDFSIYRKQVDGDAFEISLNIEAVR